MSNKQLIENKRRAHAAKVLQKMDKAGKSPESENITRKSKKESNEVSALKEQYNIIRKDLMKLRDDLTRGYDMARNVMEKKGFVRQLLKSK